MRSLWKPWYVWRPWGIVTRAYRAVSTPRSGYQPLRVSWGADVLADPTKAIGASIWTIGIYDIAVSECIARLAGPGSTVVDVGANVGYMTLLAAVASGPRGRVLAFEPLPDVFRILERNVAAIRARAGVAEIETFPVALGSSRGTAELAIPDALAENDGIAFIVQDARSSVRTETVAVHTVDDVLGGRDVHVMKLDVEGYEAEVLRGATCSLAEHRIHNVLFEDFQGPDSETARLLVEAGYSLFSVGWSVRGLEVVPASEGRPPSAYDAPSYLATIDPSNALARCAAAGWRTLRSRALWNVG